MSKNIVEDYGWGSSEGPQSCGYITPSIIRLLRGLSVKRVLDIGSGNGKLCSIISSKGYDVVGVEYDKNGVDIASKTHPQLTFLNYGVQDDPDLLIQKVGTFDVVVSTEVIEHLFSPHLLPSYAYKTLNSGGYIILTTPYHGYLKNLLLSLFDKWDKHHTPLWHGGHIKFWSRATLTQLLSENGFKVTGFSGVGRVPYLWKSMVIVAQKT
jgi:2-polyprenyl-3-methyl-5-hydroxy-6-metoxy-1,4-benzoquinol methylase